MKNDDIVIAALERDEVDVDIQGPDFPPVGSSLTLVRNGAKTEWKVVAVRHFEDQKIVLTCRRVKE